MHRALAPVPLGSSPRVTSNCQFHGNFPLLNLHLGATTHSLSEMLTICWTEYLNRNTWGYGIATGCSSLTGTSGRVGTVVVWAGPRRYLWHLSTCGAHLIIRPLMRVWFENHFCSFICELKIFSSGFQHFLILLRDHKPQISTVWNTCSWGFKFPVFILHPNCPARGPWHHLMPM